MARSEHLPIYKRSHELCLSLEQVVAGFPRYHKCGGLVSRGPATRWRRAFPAGWLRTSPPRRSMRALRSPSQPPWPPQDRGPGGASISARARQMGRERLAIAGRLNPRHLTISQLQRFD